MDKVIKFFGAVFSLLFGIVAEMFAQGVEDNEEAAFDPDPNSSSAMQDPSHPWFPLWAEDDD